MENKQLSINMNMLINQFIFASRAYSQQSPTYTRVNNLVYIFPIQHPLSLTHEVSVPIMFACGRGSVRALYYTVLYVIYKTLTSPNFTLLYHLMINLLSSHDNSHHHMMNIIYLVKSETFVSLLCLHDV